MVTEEVFGTCRGCRGPVRTRREADRDWLCDMCHTEHEVDPFTGQPIVEDAFGDRQ
jgi:ribosomal protein L37AE/L43A